METVHKTEPGIIEVDRQENHQAESGTLSPGIPGVKVNVYRVLEKNGVEAEKHLLYTAEYQPKDKIVIKAQNKRSKNRTAK